MEDWLLVSLKCVRCCGLSAAGITTPTQAEPEDGSRGTAHPAARNDISLPPRLARDIREGAIVGCRKSDPITGAPWPWKWAYTRCTGPSGAKPGWGWTASPTPSVAGCSTYLCGAPRAYAVRHARHAKSERRPGCPVQLGCPPLSLNASRHGRDRQAESRQIRAWLHRVDTVCASADSLGSGELAPGFSTHEG